MTVEEVSYRAWRRLVGQNKKTIQRTCTSQNTHTYIWRESCRGCDIRNDRAFIVITCACSLGAEGEPSMAAHIPPFPRTIRAKFVTLSSPLDAAPPNNLDGGGGGGGGAAAESEMSSTNDPMLATRRDCDCDVSCSRLFPALPASPGFHISPI